MPRKRKAIIELIQQAAAQRSTVLDLSKCNLEGLLEDVFKMNWLVELDLSHCHLNALPESIGHLTQLTRLVLAENQLPTLPDSIIQLAALRHLDLHLAGFDFKVSNEVTLWMKTVPEVIWIDGKPPNFDPPVAPFPQPNHPNVWLQRLKAALTLYGMALAMEDRGFPGEERRAEADATIRAIFGQVTELARVLPEFYEDFENHRVYSINCKSEQILDENPFQLPTREDEDWLANQPVEQEVLQSPLRLADEIHQGRRVVFAIHPGGGQKSEVVSCEHGDVTRMNQPYAEDETCDLDSAAWLYRAGCDRFYLKLETSGYGSIPGTDWYGSSDGGVSWHKQAGLTYDWLNQTHVKWRQVDYLAPTPKSDA